MKKFIPTLILSLGSILLLVAISIWYVPILNPLKLKLTGKKTVQEQLETYGPDARARLSSHFRKADVQYPPHQVTLFFSKSTRRLEIYAGNENKELRFIRDYEVLAASGKQGPKVKEGDHQVPEGIYQVEALNPNSNYHLSLRLNYPNADDQSFAQMDAREKLGSDIMIHGNRVSVGCLAIGNTAIEELFTLAAESKYLNWKVILSPIDFRRKSLDQTDRENWTNQELPWIEAHYEKIKMENLKLPGM